jgi:hypothetical protein
MQDRLSFREFKDELLLNIAILTKGETNKFINPSDAAERIEEKFSATWIMSAAEEWRSVGYLHGQTFLSGGGSFALTGAGLEHAEEVADERAADLYELIDEANAVPLADTQGNTLTDDQGNRLVVHVDPWENFEPSIVKIDHLSADFKSLDRALRDHIEVFRGNNELFADNPEAGRHLAELEAGKALLKADEADRNLVKRLLLPALTWFVKMARDETAKALAKKLIDDVMGWIS